MNPTLRSRFLDLISDLDPRITYVDLSQTRLNISDLRLFIRELNKNPYITGLDISGNRLSALDLLQLKDLRYITTLDVADTGITPAVLEYLRDYFSEIRY